MSKILNIEDFKELEILIRERIKTDQFVLGYMDENKDCITFIHPNCQDINICYIADTINQRRIKEMED